MAVTEQVLMDALKAVVDSNTGRDFVSTKALKNLAITVDGKNKAEFLVSTLKETQLASGESVEFTVKFKPSDFGKRKAVLRITSNDKDESPFDIDLAGSGAGIK